MAAETAKAEQVPKTEPVKEANDKPKVVENSSPPAEADKTKTDETANKEEKPVEKGEN